MKINYIKIALKYVFGGKEAVLDYILDLANDAVAALSDANKDKVKAVLAFAEKLLALMDKLVVFCPKKWRKAWLETSVALAAVVNAAEDLEVTKDELTGVSANFRLAYAAWRVDDSASVASEAAQ